MPPGAFELGRSSGWGTARRDLSPAVRVAGDRVGLEEVQPAGDKEGRVILERRRRVVVVELASASLLTELTMILVPRTMGRPRLI